MPVFGFFLLFTNGIVVVGYDQSPVSMNVTLGLCHYRVPRIGFINNCVIIVVI